MIISKEYFLQACCAGDRSTLESLIFAAQAENEEFPQPATGGQEENPEPPYREALQGLAEMAEGDYYVCAGCGSTWEKQRPEKCPGCRSVAINYIKVG